MSVPRRRQCGAKATVLDHPPEVPVGEQQRHLLVDAVRADDAVDPDARIDDCHRSVRIRSRSPSQLSLPRYCRMRSWRLSLTRAAGPGSTASRSVVALVALMASVRCSSSISMLVRIPETMGVEIVLGLHIRTICASAMSTVRCPVTARHSRALSRYRMPGNGREAEMHASDRDAVGRRHVENAR